MLRGKIIAPRWIIFGTGGFSLQYDAPPLAPEMTAARRSEWVRRPASK